jgi:hypothetical protein
MREDGQSPKRDAETIPDNGDKKKCRERNVITKRNGMDVRGSNPDKGKIFLLSTMSRLAQGPSLPPYSSSTGGDIPGVKLPLA